MFKKLLSNLPFNPSLIGQVSFYSKRLHSEAILRRTGLILVVMAVMLQMFAITSPPQSSLASSPNDIVNGGFKTRDDAVRLCMDKAQDFDNILAYYRVNCGILTTATTVTVKSTDYNKTLHSLGRTPQGAVIERTGKPTNEYGVFIAGKTYYMRNLWAWDSSTYSTYQMLKMTNMDNKVIFVMFNCGNIVTPGKYAPPPAPVPTPKPTPPPVKVTPAPVPQPTPTPVSPTPSPAQIPAPSPTPTPTAPTPSPTPTPTPTPTPVVPTPVTPPPAKDLCSDIPGTQTDIKECKPCESSVDNSDTNSCLTFKKAAANTTKNIADANGTTANGNDAIIYTLSVTNTGKINVAGFVIEENISDLLDYAEVTNFNGGVKDSANIVRWPATTINSGATIQKQLSVKIKNPIPETPISLSDPSHYDLVMTNVYGNAITIKLPPSITKTTETVTKTLPNTGPGESMAAVLALTVVVSYFFARSRLLAKELDIVRNDFSVSGGV